MTRVPRLPRLRSLALLALVVALASGCGRCGSKANASSSGVVPTDDAGASDTATAAGPALPADVPEVKDGDAGRATAALRAVFEAYGIPYDAAALARECNVDDDGASIDDLEDVAVKHGLEAGSVIVPVEHVLLPEAKMLPAIVIVDDEDDDADFVVAWRIEGDRVQVMHPDDGRRWVPRAELEKSLHRHEMTLPGSEYREAIGAPSSRDALAQRIVGLGVDAASARALVDRAATAPSWRGLGALDASIRGQRILAQGGAGVTKEALLATYDCASAKRCDGVSPLPPAAWSVEPAPPSAEGEEQVRVRGTMVLAIAGRASNPP
jgi:hypothetical protein